MSDNATAPKPATPHTAALNASVPVPSDMTDYERARRGHVRSKAEPNILDSLGRTSYQLNRYDFIEGDAPDTVNPSLWRQSKVDATHGLFEVAPNVWQVRGFDISNITYIKGDTGWIVIDPLTTEATARAAHELVTEVLGSRPVTAVIYTHSHIDHFGGVLGVVTQEEVDAGRCQVIAPDGFLHETVAENAIAGPAMGRRAIYQFGAFLPAGPRGHVYAGLGRAIPLGAPDLIAPTHDITHTGETLTIDGVRIEFQLTPETEAPAEMNFFFPDHGWLCMAENCNHTMHNLVPIRGAQVRDSLAWSKYINEAIELFGDRTELMFTSHHWPRWGREDVRSFLELQRDVYRWIHDQTMRLANKGLVPTEIAEELELPDDFLAQSHTHGYYGDLIHNSKAVYQRYLSWYDGNPAHLNEYPPIEAGKRYVDFMGGSDALLAKAREYFAAGDFRFVATVVNHLVFADPDNQEARHLQADALEQLGYQTESSTFRNAYLSGAFELRHGKPNLSGAGARGRGLVNAMTIEQIFDVLAVRLKSEEVGGLSARINWTFTDIDERWILGLAHRTLHHVKGRHDPGADATVAMNKSLLTAIIFKETTFVDEIQSGNINVTGDAAALLNIFGHLDEFGGGWGIVEP